MSSKILYSTSATATGGRDGKAATTDGSFAVTLGTPKELGGQLFLESNTLTPLIKRLEASGLVTRQRDITDERVVRVRLTQQGQSVAQDVSTCVPAELMEAVGISIEEIAALNQSLVTLREKLQRAA